VSRAALEAHYRLERGLADQLRTADKASRRGLYREVYDRLNRESPLYAERRAAPDTRGKARGLARLIAFVERFLPREGAVLEIGPGDAALSYALAPRVTEMIAVDVSREALTDAPPPSNFRFLLTDGFGLPVPDGSVALIISNQLMEHLHPDDAFEQLQSVHRALAPGGAYVCITPSRLTGPHDVSKHFDPVATGCTSRSTPWASWPTCSRAPASWR
jgi:SAM-dependent methyltransferase